MTGPSFYRTPGFNGSHERYVYSSGRGYYVRHRGRLVVIENGHPAAPSVYHWSISNHDRDKIDASGCARTLRTAKKHCLRVLAELPEIAAEVTILREDPPHYRAWVPTEVAVAWDKIACVTGGTMLDLTPTLSADDIEHVSDLRVDLGWPYQHHSGATYRVIEQIAEALFLHPELEPEVRQILERKEP